MLYAANKPHSNIPLCMMAPQRLLCVHKYTISCLDFRLYISFPAFASNYKH